MAMDQAANELAKRNNALNVNYPGNFIPNQGTADIAITTRGSDWYWTVTAIMLTASLAFIGMGFTKPRGERIFHYITAAITLTASVAYFSMGSGLGWTPISVEFQRSEGVVRGTAREIFYVRYIDWVITTPLLLLDILLTAGLPWPTILFTVLLDEIMVCAGLAGALVRSSYKWGYFTGACIALLWIAYMLIFEGRWAAGALGRDVGRTFFMCATWTIFLWFLYPIAWGVSEGGNVIAPDSEAVFYGILDILAKPVFGALLLWGHRNIHPSRLGVSVRDYSTAEAVRETKGGHATDGHHGHHTTNNGATATAATAATTETV